MPRRPSPSRRVARDRAGQRSRTQQPRSVLDTEGPREEAIETLSRAIALNPSYPPALVNLGVAYARTGSIQRAIDCYQQALALNPRLNEALVNLGGALLALKRYRDALASFDAALGRAPMISKAHAGRAHALEALGRAAEAVDAYHQAATFDPTDASVYLSSGQMMLRLGNVASALAAFDGLLSLDRDHLLGKEGRAKALVSLGRHEEALHALGELMQRAAPVDFCPAIISTRSCAAATGVRTNQLVAPLPPACGGKRVEVPLSFLAHSREPDEQLGPVPGFTPPPNAPCGSNWLARSMRMGIACASVICPAIFATTRSRS